MILSITVIVVGVLVVAVAIRCIVLLRRFTCASMDEAIALAQEYNKKGIRVLMNYAVESVRDYVEVVGVWAIYTHLIQRLAENKIDGDLSVKFSSLIHPLRDEGDRRLFFFRLRHLLKLAGRRTVWIDEEQAHDAWFLMNDLEVIAGEFRNLGVVVRAFRADAFERAKQYCRWHTNGSRFRARVCRGAYPKDAELSRPGTEAEFCTVYHYLCVRDVSVVAATHTLTGRVLAMRDLPLPAIHMLHGRREVKTILEPLVRERRVSEAAVYIIFGPLAGCIRYGIRRLLERPSLLVWG